MKIVFYGASIVSGRYGLPDANSETIAPSTLSYVSLFGSYLASRSPSSVVIRHDRDDWGRGATTPGNLWTENNGSQYVQARPIEIVRDGGGGRTVVDLNNYFYTVINENPDIVVLSDCGVNESLVQVPDRYMAPEDFKTSFYTLCWRCIRDRGYRTLFIPPTFESPQMQAQLVPYIQAAREVCQANDNWVKWIEVPPQVGHWDQAMDIWHPDVDGHQAIAAAIYEEFK